MAVASHVGHDKRGNKTYVRDPKGNEVIEEAEELVKEWDEVSTFGTSNAGRRVKSRFYTVDYFREK